MRRIVGLFLFTVIFMTTGKTQTFDTVVVEQIAVSEIDESDFMMLAPPPNNFKSPYKSVSDWLKHLSAVASPSPKEMVYTFGFFKSPQQYIMYLQPKRAFKNTPAPLESTALVYHSESIENFSMLEWDGVNDRLNSEVKEYLDTEAFKNSKLSEARLIFSEYNDEILWIHPSVAEIFKNDSIGKLAIAVADYLILKNQGRFVINGKDEIVGHAKRMKNQMKRYIVLGQKDKLQKSLNDAIRQSLFLDQGNINKFIEEKTGMKADILDEPRKSTEEVLQKQFIENDSEYQAVMVMQSVYVKQPSKNDFINRLDSLLRTYRGKMMKSPSHQPKPGDSPKPFFNKLAELTSPDGKNQISIYETGWDDQEISTTVSLTINDIGGTTLYSTKGRNADVKALWKDNNTIVITSKEAAEIPNKIHEIRSFDHIIRIKYIQN
ncbi:MAG: hypothetical protein ACO1OO_01310 [Flavisolibacter sp.]